MTTEKAYKELHKGLKESNIQFTDGLISHVEYGMAIHTYSDTYLANLRIAYTEEQVRLNGHKEDLTNIGY